MLTGGIHVYNTITGPCALVVCIDTAAAAQLDHGGACRRLASPASASGDNTSNIIDIRFHLPYAL